MFGVFRSQYYTRVVRKDKPRTTPINYAGRAEGRLEHERGEACLALVAGSACYPAAAAFHHGRDAYYAG